MRTPLRKPLDVYKRQALTMMYECFGWDPELGCPTAECLDYYDMPDVKSSVISNNFIMMANGTGKTTTMELIKGLFDGTAAGWTASKVRSFAPTVTEADTGEFSTTVKFDDRQYIIRVTCRATSHVVI